MTPTDPSPTRILLARHGEVDEVHRGTIYGALDVPLSPTGVRQSEALANTLAGTALDAVVSSGLRRAETAAALVRRSRADIQPEEDSRFRELDRGDWAGIKVETLRREDPESFARWTGFRGAVQAPGGESLGDLRARTLAGFHTWADMHPGGTILIVAHLWVVRSAVAESLQLPMERSAAIGLPPGGLVKIDWPSASARDKGAVPQLVQLGAPAQNALGMG